LEVCYSTPRPSGSEQVLEQFQKVLSAHRDPEPRFTQSGVFNSCLGNDFTARMAKSAIDSGFCGYDYLQMDPALATFRKSAQYPALLAQAKQCRDRFLAERDRLQ